MPHKHTNLLSKVAIEIYSTVSFIKEAVPLVNALLLDDEMISQQQKLFLYS